MQTLNPKRNPNRRAGARQDVANALAGDGAQHAHAALQALAPHRRSEQARHRAVAACRNGSAQAWYDVHSDALQVETQPGRNNSVQMHSREALTTCGSDLRVATSAGRTYDEVDVGLTAAHGGDDDVEQVDALAIHQPAERDDGHAPVDAASGAREVRLECACVHRCSGNAKQALVAELVAQLCIAALPS